ncbi:kinase-like domain-containing protein [Rhizophagus clarus]|uniref:Kinase-like domain-containing protein n=1 Tax=Rhizophagus clarus TaxID=94130 RepID=A0A8H3QM39_9GLOM|nr:kinase-like domain-containing protein [Rhizophagus clarus]
MSYLKCESCDGIYTNIIYKWCRPCKINNLKKNFTNWTSGNEKIDDFIQGMQLNIERFNDIIVEWIPYAQLNDIEKIGESDFATAIWKDSSLGYIYKEGGQEGKFDKEVTLKFVNNSRNNFEFLNEVKIYSIKIYEYKTPKIYGISQNPDTKDYIIVIQDDCNCEKCYEMYTNIFRKWCNPCQMNDLKKNFTSWTSGNEKIDNFIQEMQLKIGKWNDTIIEWIPHNQLDNIKKIDKGDFATASWKDGLLEYNYKKRKLERNPNIKIALKYLNNSQSNMSEFLNEAKAYSIIRRNENNVAKIYGISKNPNSNDYVMVFQDGCCCENCGEIYTDISHKWCKPCQLNRLNESFANWTSENEKVDSFIQEMQLKIERYDDITIKWIPYNQFINIKETDKDGLAIAIWKDDSLEYSYKEDKSVGSPTSPTNKEVGLKCLNNSQNNISEFLNEVKTYSIKDDEFNIPKIYGISQKPDTNDYVIVIQDVYSALWKDGPLQYDEKNQEYNRRFNKKVALKCLHSSQNITDSFLNEIKAYSIDKSYGGILNIYGISRNPVTKDHIIVLEYANSGSLNNSHNNIIKNYYWNEKLYVLSGIVRGLRKLHENEMIHCDLHTGNILVSLGFHSYSKSGNSGSDIYVSDMGLCCREADNMDETKIYGVMPFVAPEVLKGKPYTQAADIYSLGMIMYFIATGRQPFANCAHDHVLVLKICNGIRPKISKQEAPKFYIDLMERCWDSNPNNRPNIIEIKNLISLSFQDKEITKQIDEAEEYRKTYLLSSIEKNQSIHSQAYYTSRLLNPFTRELSNCANVSNSNSVEVTDFTNENSFQKSD